MSQIPDIPVITIGRAKDNILVLSQEDISRYHARIIVCSTNSFIFEDMNSKNGTFVNDLRIDRKLVDIDDTVTIASYPYLVKELLVFNRNEDLATKSDPLDFVKEFSELEKVYNDYPKLRKACRDRDKMVRLWSVLGASVIGIGSTLTAGGLGVLAVLSSAGLGVLVPTLASNLLSTEEKLELIDKEYRQQYRCPNPSCKDAFGSREYEDLTKQKSCKKCKAIWVK